MQKNRFIKKLNYEDLEKSKLLESRNKISSLPGYGKLQTIFFSNQNTGPFPSSQRGPGLRLLRGDAPAGQGGEGVPQELVAVVGWGQAHPRGGGGGWLGGGRGFEPHHRWGQIPGPGRGFEPLVAGIWHPPSQEPTRKPRKRMRHVETLSIIVVL